MRVRQEWQADTAIVLAFALGMGLTAAILSAVWSILLRPLPFPEPGQLVHLEAQDGGPLSSAEIRQIRERIPLLESIAAYGAGAAYNLSSGQQPEEVPTVIATRDLFEVLKVPLQFGETWPESFDRQRDFGVVLSDRLFRTRFGADPSIVGKTITLDAYPGYRVFGVAAPGFEFPADRWMYRSSGIFQDSIDALDYRFAFGVARLRDDVTLSQFQHALDDVAGQLAAESPSTNRGISYHARPLADVFVGALRPAMLLLLVAVALLMILAVVNCAHLFAARVSSQRGKYALQLALGATPRHLANGILGRGLQLALIGSILGIGVAFFSLEALWHELSTTLPEWMPIRLETRPVFLSLTIAALAATLATYFPAREIARLPPAACLQETSQRSTGSRAERRRQRIMLVTQVALGFVLVGAGTQFGLDALRAYAHPSGFSTEQRMAFRVALPWAKYDVKTHSSTRFYDQLGVELSALPGIQRVAWSTRLPATTEGRNDSGSLATEIRLPEDATTDERRARPLRAKVSEGFFAATGISLLAGRDFGNQDRPDTVPVAIVNQKLAGQLWSAAETAIGKRLQIPGDDANWNEFEVIGVVDDVRFDLANADAPAVLYRSLRQHPDLNAFVLISHRGSAPSEALLRGAMAKVDPEQSLYDVATLDDLREQQLWQPRLLAALLIGFALSALALIAMGIGGLSRLWVTQRRRDAAVRAALGADAWRIGREHLAEVLRILLWGLAAAIPCLLAIQYSTRSLQVLPTSWQAIALVPVCAALLVTLLLAALPAARSAARSDPATLLR